MQRCGLCCGVFVAVSFLDRHHFDGENQLMLVQNVRKF